MFVQSKPDKLVLHGPLLQVYTTKSSIINIKSHSRATFLGVGQGLIMVRGSLRDMQEVSNQPYCVILSYPLIFQVCAREGQQLSLFDSQVQYRQGNALVGPFWVRSSLLGQPTSNRICAWVCVSAPVFGELK